MRNNKGIAMLLVISLILMLLILGGAVLMISTGHFSTSYAQTKRTRAYYAAEAAMQHILWQLRTNDAAAGTLPATFDVNGIKNTDIQISIGPVNPSGTNPEGVQPIDITVNY